MKLWDAESTGEQIWPSMGPDTAIIPLQNSVDASERRIPIVGAAHVLGGVAVVTGSIIAPGADAVRSIDGHASRFRAHLKRGH